MSELDELTPSEREVLQLVAAGLTNEGIADKPVISVNTVQTHLSRILAKRDGDAGLIRGRRYADTEHAFSHTLTLEDLQAVTAHGKGVPSALPKFDLYREASPRIIGVPNAVYIHAVIVRPWLAPSTTAHRRYIPHASSSAPRPLA